MNDLLERILSKVGDLNFRRRIITVLKYLDVQEGDVILDAGCGEGFYPMLLTKLYKCKVVGIDNDPKILKNAKKWNKGNKNIKFMVGDICKLRFKDDYFDKIICSEVLEHLDNDKKAVEELFRVLKPGGILAVTVPNKNYPFLWDPLNKIREGLGLGHFNALSGFWGGIWAYDHKRLYLPKELRSLLRKGGFKVKKLEVLTHYGIPFNHLVLYVGKSLYTKFPVFENVKSAMEKFEWKKSPDSGSWLINFGFSILKHIDKLNDRKFSLDTSTMAVAAKVTKR